MEVLGRALRVVQRHRGCAAPARNTARLDANDAPRAAEERLAVCALQAVDRAGRVVHRSTLSCGSYGLPLGHYITHHLGATAIYVGGALQLFFGLRGLRWRREIAPYASDAWACPERPKWDTSGMENYGLGPYWCPPAKN